MIDNNKLIELAPELLNILEDFLVEGYYEHLDTCEKNKTGERCSYCDAQALVDKINNG